MNPIVRIFWSVISILHHVDINLGKIIKKVSTVLQNQVEKVYVTAENLINGNDSIKISSGVKFEQDWVVFKRNVRIQLQGLNLFSQISSFLRKMKESSVKQILRRNESKLVQKLNNWIMGKLEKLFSKMAEYKGLEIVKNLRKENFFNMSGKQITKEVVEYLKLGKNLLHSVKLIYNRS